MDSDPDFRIKLTRLSVPDRVRPTMGESAVLLRDRPPIGESVMVARLLLLSEIQQVSERVNRSVPVPELRSAPFRACAPSFCHL